MGGLILTPGFETNNSSSEHYTVYVAKADVGVDQDPNQEIGLFLDPLVKGALFFQHHMMSPNQDGQMAARPKETIKAQINVIHTMNKQRIENGHAPLECSFDAEPAPVQQRRFYHNPPNWPTTDAEQIEIIQSLVNTGALTDFLAKDIDELGYYPLLPSQQSLGMLASNDIKSAQKVAFAIGAITGHALGQLGIDTLYAPVVDINAAAFPERCYGEDPDVIIALAEQWTLGAMSHEGIQRICFKHAPGHGVPIVSAQGQIDTHNAICRTDANLATIKHHMQVFTELVTRIVDQGIATKSIRLMTNHIIYSAIDSSMPVSLSRSGMSFIQDQLPTQIDCVADCVNMASFSSSQENFHTNIAQALQQHLGGVIATTHYVKKASRKEMISQLRKHVMSASS
ncbi:MAG: hypothetical protein CMF43_06150 [Legionellales bacterium]|nr:hypothetical protein [Legionellales bacterium]|tara:strand:- start:2029 stop:3222 length:1194 start_codon:yes stop_codon:yes gene_type:complete